MLEFLARSLEASTIFTFAAIGELIDQRSGILNVGIEGVMLFGATLGFIAAQTTDSYLIGFAVSDRRSAPCSACCTGSFRSHLAATRL